MRLSLKEIFKMVGWGVVCGVALLAVSRCGGNSNNSLAPSYMQIERLGRPAINEGLLLSNDYLNAFNGIPPSADLSAAATPVLTEAGTVLGVINTFGTANSLPAPAVADVVGGFLPDVMRIDTSLSIPAAGAAHDVATANAQQAYLHAAAAGSVVFLVGGRKITDNVVNITLGYLFAGAGNAADSYSGGQKAWDNGTNYYGTGITACSGAGSIAAGSSTNPSAPGHHCLNGQTAPYGAATFPFLAAAN